LTVAFCLHMRQPDRPPFPTRRSSDLHPLPARYPGRSAVRNGAVAAGRAARARIARVSRPWNQGPSRLGLGALAPVFRGDLSEIRSEEHTSELQSRFDLVCRLLLEKKK